MLEICAILKRESSKLVYLKSLTNQIIKSVRIALFMKTCSWLNWPFKLTRLYEPVSKSLAVYRSSSIISSGLAHKADNCAVRLHSVQVCHKQCLAGVGKIFTSALLMSCSLYHLISWVYFS
jgi:hypothetical protein